VDAREGLPKIYGDKLTAEVTGKDGGPIETTHTEIEVARRIAFLLTSAVDEARKPRRGTRACRQLSQNIAETSWMAARNVLASLS
jgi:hypothetical protein